jgi:hypothetical protein
MTFIIRDVTGGVSLSENLVLPRGVAVGADTQGVPTLLGASVEEIQLDAQGGDETARIQAALDTGANVRLGPGTFLVSAALQVGLAAPVQQLAGSGQTATRLYMTASAPVAVIQLRNYGCTVESLYIDNPGNVIGILAAVTPGGASQITGITIRDVRFDFADLPIQVENPVHCLIEDVYMNAVPNYGVYVTATAAGCEGLTMRNVVVRGGTCLVGVRVNNVSAVAMESVLASRCTQHGVWISGGAGHHLAGVRVVECGAGITIQNTGAASLEAAEVVGVPGSGLVPTQTKGIHVDASKDVAVHACRVVKMPEAVRVTGSENVVIGAVRSDTSGTTIANPHLLVSASPGVFVTSFRVVNPAVPPAFEVDVAGAGSRVLFGPHNFTPARINSGGNFAAL